MISLPQYKALGDDGQEYGPVYSEQICQWIAEGRLEKKSPVKPPDAKDWVFLGDLPEFAEAFQQFEAPIQARQRAAKWRVAVVLLALAGMALLVLIKVIPHHHH